MRTSVNDRTDLPAAVQTPLVVGGALLVAVVSPLELVAPTDIWSVSAPAPWGVVAGVALAIAAQWSLGDDRARRGVSVLAILGGLTAWLLVGVVSPEQNLHVRPWVHWAAAAAVYALLLGVGIAGIQGRPGRAETTRTRVATGLLVVGASVVATASLAAAVTGPPAWVQPGRVSATDLVFAVVAVGVVAEWLLVPRGWTRATTAVVGGAGLTAYVLFGVVAAPAGGATTVAGWAGLGGSVAVSVGGALSVLMARSEDATGR